MPFPMKDAVILIDGVTLGFVIGSKIEASGFAPGGRTAGLRECFFMITLQYDQDDLGQHLALEKVRAGEIVGVGIHRKNGKVISGQCHLTEWQIYESEGKRLDLRFAVCGNAEYYDPDAFVEPVEDYDLGVRLPWDGANVLAVGT